MAYPAWQTVPVRPDHVRDNWDAYCAWVATLTQAERAIWERWGNDDDGPDTRFMVLWSPNGEVGAFQMGGRWVGRDVCAALDKGPAYGWQNRQELFEWMAARNPYHNRDFFTNWRPVKNPDYKWGKPASGDWRDEENETAVLRYNPFYTHVKIFGVAVYRGNRSTKPPSPPPHFWIKRPPELGLGGADDRGFDTDMHYP